MRVDSFREPVTLPGRFVRLLPLARAHRDDLRAAARDPEIGNYLLDGPGSTLEDMDRLIALILDRQAQGTDLAFTTARAEDGRPVGMTRYLSIDRPNHAVEIGGTWLGREYWRTPYNTETKYLLLRHAFEVERAHRVFLKTDLRNERAQRAIERIGATREAVLREHLRLRDGHYRTSVYFSVLEGEWPRVKSDLETKLARPWNGSVPHA